MCEISRVWLKHVDAIPVEPPPFRTEPTSTEATILGVECGEGLTGHAIVDPYQMPFGTQVLSEFVTGRLTPFLHGESPLLSEWLWRRMTKGFMGRGLNALAPALRAADVAIWDLRGKVLGVPMWQMLGGASETVAAYISCGTGGPNTGRSYSANYRQQPRYSATELADEASYIVAKGHTRVKVMVGRTVIPDPDEDYDRVAAVRAAVGPDVWIAVDGGSNMELHDAARLCDRLEELDVRFFEEPIVRDDPALLASLRATTSIPIGAGPIGDRTTYADLVRQRSLDFLQPNLMGIGMTEAKAVADMAASFGVGLANGNGYGPHNVSLQAGSIAGSLVEYHMHSWKLYDAIFDGVPAPSGGSVSVSNEPGFGLEPNAYLTERLASSA